jgi:hypothetical protein
MTKKKRERFDREEAERESKARAESEERRERIKVLWKEFKGLKEFSQTGNHNILLAPRPLESEEYFFRGSVYDLACNVIETHEHKGEFKEA